MTILDKIKLVDYPTDRYYQEDGLKRNQIVLHHTAGDSDPYAVLTYWKSQADKVATHFVIAGTPVGKKSAYQDGDIIQLYSTRNSWAWHLGLTQAHLNVGGPKHSTNTLLNKQSIAIEICSWGGLTQKGTKYYSYDGTLVPASQVQSYPNGYRGYHFYQKYSDAQLENLGELITYLCDKYAISTDYHPELFDVWPSALCGINGITSHVSYRPAPEKFDNHPQPELIEMLKSL